MVPEVQVLQVLQEVQVVAVVLGRQEVQEGAPHVLIRLQGLNSFDGNIVDLAIVETYREVFFRSCYYIEGSQVVVLQARFVHLLEEDFDFAAGVEKRVTVIALACCHVVPSDDGAHILQVCLQAVRVV